MDDLHERINDYIFFSNCDIDPTKAKLSKLKNFNRECNELEIRFEKEVREIKKIS